MDNEDQVPRHPERARLAVLLFAQHLCRQDIPQEDAWHHFVKVANDIADGTNTDAASALLAIYRLMGADTVVFGEQAGDMLFAELHATATLFQQGLMGYPGIEDAEGVPAQAIAMRRRLRGASTSADSNVRRRRRRIELTLRYQQLLLEAVGSYSKPRDESTWKRRMAHACDQPFSQNALGLGLLMRASILDRLRELEGEVSSFVREGNLAFEADDDFIGYGIEKLAADINQATSGRHAWTTWTTAFSNQIAVMSDDIASRLDEFISGHGRCLVVSDVHLGVAAGNEAAFGAVLDICDRGDRLVLLGDILDFWIHLEGPDDLEKTVVAQWRHLYRQIEALRRRGVTVDYVLGNHDMFVFILEAYGHLDWCASVVARCPQLVSLHQALADYRLASVCDIHYPFLKLSAGNSTFLLTHGHAHELTWHFLTGNPYEDGVFVTFLQTAATVLAYRFARELRGVFNLSRAPIDWVRHTSDLALTITNRHLIQYANRNPRLDTLEQRGAFIDSLVREFEHLITTADRSEIEAIEATRAFDQLEQWHQEPPSAIREATRRYVEENRRELNFRVWSPARSQIAMSTARLNDYQTFDKFICGHYHKPRDQSPDHDSGCLLQPGPTACVMISAQGRVLRPAALF
jgi:hypothetical protein